MIGSRPIGRVLAVLGRGARDLVTPPAGSVPGLDLLRTLAIGLVLSGHFYGEFAAGLGHDLAIGRLPVFLFSWTGVDLFFVLSGYLIGRQLWRELAARGTIDVPRFLLRRGLRIWPFYFAFVAWLIAMTGKPPASFIPDMLFISNYVRGNVSGGWSLSIEEQFYLCAPLLLVALYKSGVTIRRQFAAVAVLLAVAPVIRWLTLYLHGGPVGAEAFRKIVQFPFHTHADGLLAGVLIAWLSVCAPAALAVRPWRRNLLLPGALIAAGAVLHGLDRRLLGFSALALIFSAAVIFALRDRSTFSRLAGLRGFYVLSRLSYGMYLNHFGIVLSMVPSFVALRVAVGVYPAFFLGLALTGVASVVVSACTFVLVESPFLQLREKWLSGRAATPAAAPV